MIKIAGISNGIVIDHIDAGVGMQIFNYFGLDKANHSVALINNANSKHFGKKDIIKIEDCSQLDIDLLSVFGNNITVNYIDNNMVTKKVKPNKPKMITGILKCKNPRCITANEEYVVSKFKLDANSSQYCCKYCEQLIKFKN